MSQASNDTQNEQQEQLFKLLNEQWDQEIVPLLPADYEQAARQLGAYQRHRGVHGVAALLRALLVFVLSATSLRHLGAWAVLINLADISHVAWHKRLQRSRSWLCWLLIQLLALPNASPAAFGQGSNRVVLVDATRLKRPGGCGDDWRAHIAYDLMHARLLDVRVSDQHTAEGFTLFAWQPGDVVVADRGYCSRPHIAWLLSQQADVLVRVKRFPLVTVWDQPFDMVCWLRSKPSGGRFERLVRFEHEQQVYQGRLIAQSLSEEEAERARARLRRKASQKQ